MRKIGLIFHLSGTCLALLCLFLNYKYNIIAGLGLPVETGSALIAWEFVHIALFNYHLHCKKELLP